MNGHRVVLLAAASFLALASVGAAEVPAFKLVAAERPGTVERKIRAAVDEGYAVLSAGMGRSLTGESRIVVLMGRVAQSVVDTEYAVIDSSDDFDHRGEGRSANELAAEGFRLHPDGLLARQVVDWWLPESAYDDQLVLLMERKVGSRGHRYVALAFAGTERFRREIAEYRMKGFAPVGMVSAGRRLRVILERPLDGGDPPAGAFESRPYDVVVSATPHAAIRALERDAKRGYRVVDAVDPAIHTPPLFLLSAVDGRPAFEQYRFVDKPDERLRKGRLEARLNRRALKGYRVVPSAVTPSRIAVGRPREAGGPAEYRVVSSRRPPGLPRALEQALADGYEFLAMLVVADETAVVLERTRD